MNARNLMKQLAAFGLATATVDAESMPRRMRALQRLGVPYTDEEIAQSADAVRGKTEMDAIIAYLQVLGTAVR